MGNQSSLARTVFIDEGIIIVIKRIKLGRIFFMKHKGVVVIGIIALVIIFLGIRLIVSDFHFIDGIMIIPSIALPIAFVLHLIGIVLQNTIKIKYIYLLTFLAYVVGVLFLVEMNNLNDLLDGVSGFILLFILYPSFICHVSIVIYYIYAEKKIFSAEY